jgi:long-chain fatty acid transport protein
MKARRTVGIIVALWMVLAATHAHATDGYFDIGFGVKAKGAGGVGVAFPQDALAPATNPAGISFLPSRADVGVTWFKVDRGASLGGASYDGNETSNFFIPELGAIQHLSRRFTVGVAVYGNGGLNTDYSTPIPAFGTTDAGINLTQLFVAPTVAFALAPRHSIGLSPILAYQRFAAKGLESFGVTNAGTDSSYGAGARIGYTGDITDWLSVGATYQSRTYATKFKDYKNLFAEQGNFDIPSNFALGVAAKPLGKLTLAVDVERILFSEVKSVGNPLNAQTFGNGLGANDGPGFGWNDVTALKAGASYIATDRLTLRAGYNYSTQPVPRDQTFFNILAPAVVQHHLTLGLTVAATSHIELSAVYVHAFENQVNGAGNFNNGDADLHMSQNSVGVAVGYLF